MFALTPIVNSMLDLHEAGDWKEGVEAFQADLTNRMFAAGLLRKDVWVDVEEVGVYPDNREGAMLVPVDVHDLLLRMSTDGFSWAQWTAMGCDVPQSEVGRAWCNHNVKLAEGSGGLLPPYRPDILKVLTGRGSHGTAAIRVMKMGAVGIHDDICSDGVISRSKIMEKNPTMALPLERGCRYDIIHSSLVIACPRLMGVLSRLGNASHNVFRVATALQHCNRIHALAVQQMNRGPTPQGQFFNGSSDRLFNPSAQPIR